MGPLIPQGIIGGEWSQVIAILLGMGFGFVLESSGFSSTRKLAGVFYGYDFVVLKVFFTAAITAMIGLIYFNYLGWIDMSLVFVNPTFINASILGGIIMGFGFIMGGYCPGTSFCGVAIGKIDAMIFTGGLFIGILIFSEIYPYIKGFYNEGSLGVIKIYDTLGVSMPVFVFGVIISALAVFYTVGIIEKKVRKVEY